MDWVAMLVARLLALAALLGLLYTQKEHWEKKLNDSFTSEEETQAMVAIK
jgi:hypothetical protein